MQEYLDILGYDAWRRYEELYAGPAAGPGDAEMAKATTSRSKRRKR
jgi:hypothetical protein